MSFKSTDKDQLREWAQANQPKAAAANRRRGKERADYIMSLLNAGFYPNEIAHYLGLSMSATYTAIHRAKKRSGTKKPSVRIVDMNPTDISSDQSAGKA